MVGDEFDDDFNREQMRVYIPCRRMPKRSKKSSAKRRVKQIKETTLPIRG